MSFHRAERLVTAFLCISGAAESCVLPFLCLHLTQLGVPPLQTGLAVSALLLLRGLSGALWWRSLRGDRRTSRRRLAAAAGALVSVVVMCGLAALPPSTGCGGRHEGVVSSGHVFYPLGHGHPPLEGAPVPPQGQVTITSATAPSGGGPPDVSHLTPVEGVSGSQRPPSAGGGGGGDGDLRPSPASSGGSGSRPATSDVATSQHLRPTNSGNSETSEHQRPGTIETNEHQRPETSETSWEHQPTTSETNWNHRPETSEASVNHRPTISESDANHRPSSSETSENSPNHRPENNEATPPHRPDQSKTNEQIHRPKLTEPTESRPTTGTISLEPPTTPGISDHLSWPPPAQGPSSGAAKPSTRPQTLPAAIAGEGGTEGATDGLLSGPQSASPNVPSGGSSSSPSEAPSDVPPSVTSSALPSDPSDADNPPDASSSALPVGLPGVVSGAPAEQQGGSSDVNTAGSTSRDRPVVSVAEANHNQRPAVAQAAQGTQTVTGSGTAKEATETETGREGQDFVNGDDWDGEDEGVRLPVGITGALAQPGGYHYTSSDSQNASSSRPSFGHGTQSEASGLQIISNSQETISDSQQNGFGVPQTMHDDGERIHQDVIHHNSNPPSAFQPSVQSPAFSDSSLTPNQVGHPASASGHQTSDVLNSYINDPDETVVSRTTRSPLPVGLVEGNGEESGDNIESESSGFELESGRSESESGRSESESGRYESESEASGMGMATGGVGHFDTDTSQEFESPSGSFDPTRGSADSRPLADSSAGNAEEQGRIDETDQRVPVSPPRSDPPGSSAAENEERHPEGKQSHHHHHHHHHRHHSTEDRDDKEDTGRAPSHSDVESPHHEIELSHHDAESPHHDVDNSRQEETYHYPSTDDLNNHRLDLGPSYQPPLEKSRPPLADEDSGRSCVELSEVEIPWDPRKHPEGLTICDPSPGSSGNNPARHSAGQRSSQREGQPSSPTSLRQEGHPPGHLIRQPSIQPPDQLTGQPAGQLSDYPSDQQSGYPSGHLSGQQLGQSRGQAPSQRHRLSLERHRFPLPPPPPPPPPPSSHPLAVRDPSDPDVGRGQPRPPSDRGDPDPARDLGHSSGRSRHRAAGWRRVPVWARDEQTPDHPHSVNSLEDPIDQPIHSLQTMQRTVAQDDNPIGGKRNYNLPQPTEAGADLRAAILRPQDTLPLLAAPGWRIQQSQYGGSGDENEDPGRSGTKEGWLGRLDEHQRFREEIIRLRKNEESALSKDQASAWSGNSQEAERLRAPVSSSDDLRARDDSHLQHGEIRPAIRTGAANEDAGSSGQYEVSTGESEVRSRDRESETWDSAEAESRDGPITVDPSGWSRQSWIGPEDRKLEEGDDRYEPNRDDKDDEDAAPRFNIIKHHHHQPISHDSLDPDRPASPPSSRRSSGRRRNYNLPSRSTDGESTVDPTGGWSLAGSLRRLEELSPTLTRLLSGGKRRRETIRRPKRRRKRVYRRHSRRRQKRSVIDAPVEDIGSENEEIEDRMRSDQAWRRKDVAIGDSRSRKMNSRPAPEQGRYSDVPSTARNQLKGGATSLRSHSIDDRTKISSQNFSQSTDVLAERLPRSARALPASLPDPSSSHPSHPSPLDPYLLFLITLGLLSLWGTAGAPHRRLVLHCWRRALDEAEHLERADRPRPAAEAASAAILTAAAGLYPLLPGCLPAGRQPLAALLALGAVLALIGAVLVPWLPLVGGKEPPQRTGAVVRALVSCRSSLLFTVSVFVTGVLTSAELHFLFPLTATWRSPPKAAVLLTAAVALASRLPVRALYRPLMVRCGFVGSVVLSFTALSVRCLCYVCLPSVWGLVPAQLLAGLTDTLFWRAAHVFIDKTAHDGYQSSTLSVLESLYTAGRCCGVLLAGAAFSTVGGLATFAGLATAGSAAALGYYVTARFSGDSPDLAYSKLPCDDRSETAALTGPWSRDTDDPDEVTDAAPASAADQDWLERAMRKEGLL